MTQHSETADGSGVREWLGMFSETHVLIGGDGGGIPDSEQVTHMSVEGVNCQCSLRQSPCVAVI